MVVNIEVGTIGLYLLHAQALECLLELLEYQFHTLANGVGIVALVGKGALKVVLYWQNGSDRLLAACQYEVCLLFQRALAEVLKLSLLI